MMIFLLPIEYPIVLQYIQPIDELTEISGTVINVKLESENRSRSGLIFFYIITIQEDCLQFRVSEEYEKAYNYIDENNIIGSRTKVLYGNEGMNNAENFIYNIYSIDINKKNILSVEEVKNKYLIIILIFLLLNLFLLYIIKLNLKGRPLFKFQSN